MRERLPIVLSASALLVAVFGATPLGHAASRAIHAVPPFAKTASYAKFAGNASKLNGRKSTLSGAPGTIPVVGRNGKLPASIGTVRPQGPKGDAGAKGDKGLKGDPGDKGTDSTTRIVLVRVFGNNATPGQVSQATATCGSGERLIGGGAENISVGAVKKPILQSFPTGPVGAAPTGWFVQALNDDTTGVTAVARALCASP
jgi:hypothetical protein